MTNHPNRLAKIQRLAMEQGADLIEREDGWYWRVNGRNPAGPFESASHAAYDYLNGELMSEVKQRRAARRLGAVFTTLG